MKVKIVAMTRLLNTKSGNPRYALSTTNGSRLFTKSDSTVGYVAGALEQYLHETGDAVSVEVTVDELGMVTHIMGYGD